MRSLVAKWMEKGRVKDLTRSNVKKLLVSSDCLLAIHIKLVKNPFTPSSASREKLYLSARFFQ